MSITLSMDLNSIYYLPDWVCHPTLVDNFLFQSEHAEQAGRAKGWRPAQACGRAFLQQRDLFARSAIEVRCSRCEAPKPYISINTDNDLNNDKTSNNNINNDGDDNLNDGTEDTNHNGRIDGDNGDGIYQTTEYWTETNPNEGDTDSDGINDDVELQHNYDPKNKDTDSDGLLDSEEDSLTTGTIGVLDSGETDPTKMDTDGDGLTDSQEINGWTVVITYGATGEVKDRYEINSDPRQVHSDTDQVSDYEEYKNACDPRLDDTDGDGKNDYIEIFEYDDSTPTSIDGTPPNITRLEKDYEIKWGGFLGVIPEGVQLNLDITVKDDFGVKWVNIWVEKLGEKRLYFSDEQVVEGSYDFDIGASDASNFLYKGFKINVSAMDRNDNLGFKDVKMPGITEMVMDALLGPLLAAVKFISELASGIFNWINNLIISLYNAILKPIGNALMNFYSMVMEPFNFMIENIFSASITEIPMLLLTGLTSFVSLIYSTPIISIISLLFLIPPIIEVIVNGVSFGLGTIISAVASIIIPIIIEVVGSTVGGDIGNLMTYVANGDILGIFNIILPKIAGDISNEGSKAIDLKDTMNIIHLLSTIFGFIFGLVGSFVLDQYKRFGKIDSEIIQIIRHLQKVMGFINQPGFEGLPGDVVARAKAQKEADLIKLKDKGKEIEASESLPFHKMVIMLISLAMGILSLGFTMKSTYEHFSGEEEDKESWRIASAVVSFFGMMWGTFSLILGLLDKKYNHVVKFGPGLSFNVMRAIQLSVIISGALNIGTSVGVMLV